MTGETDTHRALGLPRIGTAPWGTHLCHFFGTQQDLLDILVPFFRAGLENNERCSWITCEPLQVDEATQALSREVGDLERRIAQGQLTIMPFSDWYGSSSSDWERNLAGVVPTIEQALADGYAGVRSSGNVATLEEHLWRPFMAYEEAYDKATEDQPAVTLCTYSLAQCDAPRLLDVLTLHRFALVRRGDWTLIEPVQEQKESAAVDRLHEAVAERTSELHSALADLRGVSSWVSRDLRAPLRSITSFGEWLAESSEGKLDDDERDLLRLIRASAERMDALFRGIRAYTHAQQYALDLEILDLEALVREVWATVSDAIDDRHIDLHLEPLPRVYADRALLRQVLVNLLDNAVKFTGKKPDGHVSVGSVTTDGASACYVRDNGAGFDMARAPRLFVAFERLHARTDFEGDGLGLAIVKRIITRHGGRVWAEGSPGAGATFYFTLPDPGVAPAPPAPAEDVAVR